MHARRTRRKCKKKKCNDPAMEQKCKKTCDKCDPLPPSAPPPSPPPPLPPPPPPPSPPPCVDTSKKCKKKKCNDPATVQKPTDVDCSGFNDKMQDQDQCMREEHEEHEEVREELHEGPQEEAEEEEVPEDLL
jgi:hypothetical protein